jgi:hypothetical protein
MTRLDCTVQVVENQMLVGKQFQGVAHLEERTFDEHMTFWFGAINIDCSSVQEWYALWEKRILIRLEDGRIGHAHCQTGHAKEVLVQTQAHEIGSNYLINFMGLTSLQVPPAQ